MLQFLKLHTITGSLERLEALVYRNCMWTGDADIFCDLYDLDVYDGLDTLTRAWIC